MTPDPPPLPPALARLVAGLRLSSGFTLSFVTGPRDHRDSVFLRLARELQREFDLVRHRLDRDGLQFFDVLSGQADERPRLVFVSGLENMSEEDRRETIARLNLVRDSWAPHPARVVFWLPSWGLREFRDLAPDLFDWRSNLTVLHDADLPVRDELELLVWTCERHAAHRDIRGWPLPDVRGSRYFGPPLADPLLMQLLRERRVVFTGYGAAERDAILGHFMTRIAASRLVPLLSTSDRPARPIFDLDVARIPVDQRIFGPCPVPIRLRALDAAGDTSESTSWAAAARVAGVPGSEAASGALAELADRGELLVLLDGFDHLSEESPTHRLVCELSSSPAQLAGFTSGPPPPSMRAWKVMAQGSVDRSGVIVDRALGAPTNNDLAMLLARLFPGPDDLRLLAAHLFGSDVFEDLPTHGSRLMVAPALVLALERRNLLDRAFFDELLRVRPAHAEEIETAARRYFEGS